MSHHITASWECGLCLKKNDNIIVKPKPFGLTVTWAECAECKTKFLLRYKLAKEKQIEYDSIECLPTEAGKQMHKEREDLKLKSKALTPETQPKEV